MDNQQHPQPYSVADYRQRLIQTLTLILGRERQWLAQLESQPAETIKPLIDYMADHLNILNDSVGTLTTGRYKSLLPGNDDVAVIVC